MLSKETFLVQHHRLIPLAALKEHRKRLALEYKQKKQYNVFFLTIW